MNGVSEKCRESLGRHAGLGRFPCQFGCYGVNNLIPGMWTEGAYGESRSRTISIPNQQDATG